jgi:hypothetical protein
MVLDLTARTEERDRRGRSVYPLKWRGTPDRKCTGETVSLSTKYLRGIKRTDVVSPVSRLAIFSTIMPPGHEPERGELTK